MEEEGLRSAGSIRRRPSPALFPTERRSRVMIGYGERILDHYRRPRNEGSLALPDIRHEDLNPLCGDRVRIELQLGEGERIAAAKFRSDGCILCVAASSILTERITGST